MGFVGISEDSRFSGIRFKSITFLRISGNVLRFEERNFTTSTGKKSTNVFVCNVKLRWDQGPGLR